jgi:hypothetical protein
MNVQTVREMAGYMSSIMTRFLGENVPIAVIRKKNKKANKE